MQPSRNFRWNTQARACAHGDLPRRTWRLIKMFLLDSASLRGVSFALRPPLSRLIWYGRMTKDARDYCAAARRETHPECGRYPARVSPSDDKMTGDETGPHVMCGHYPRYAREQHAPHQWMMSPAKFHCRNPWLFRVTCVDPEIRIRAGRNCQLIFFCYKH